MNYELAKKLRKAGFKYAWCNDMSEKAPEGCPATCEKMGCYPSLSELIEACVQLSEDGDFHLEHLDNEWGAATCYKPKKSGEWYTGKTSEEAVANLWLELNKK